MEKHRDLEQTLLSIPVSRGVGIEITNRTSVTLHNPSYFCRSGKAFAPPGPSISPRSRETCVFVKRSLSAWGVSGALLYKSEAFSFALMFYNTLLAKMYAVEIFDRMITIESLEGLYWSMRSDRFQSQAYRKERLNRTNSSITVSAGIYRISATMSNHKKTIFKVLLEETRGPPPQYTPNSSHQSQNTSSKEEHP